MESTDDKLILKMGYHAYLAPKAKLELIFELINELQPVDIRNTKIKGEFIPIAVYEKRIDMSIEVAPVRVYTHEEYKQMEESQ